MSKDNIKMTITFGDKSVDTDLETMKQINRDLKSGKIKYVSDCHHVPKNRCPLFYHLPDPLLFSHLQAEIEGDIRAIRAEGRSADDDMYEHGQLEIKHRRLK